MMHKLVKTLSVAALLAAGIGGGLVTVDGSANAAKLHTVKWNKKMKMHKMALTPKSRTKKAYTLKKVHGKKYTFKTAYNLKYKKYNMVYKTQRHAKIDNTIYYYVTGFNGYYTGKRAHGAWIAKNCLESYGTAPKQTKKRASATTAKAKANATKKTTGKATATSSKTSSKTTGSKTSSSKNATSSKSGSMYIASTKHITWSQWLNLPAFGKEGNGITLYNVDNVPYDEDGFPYVSNKMASSSPIVVTQLKSEFTASAYAAIPDKANTYYLGDKNALYHPTNPEVGQAIRDKIPSDTNFDNSKQSQAEAGSRVGYISSNGYIIDLKPGDSEGIIMWAGTYGNVPLTDLQRNSYTMTSANTSIATVPSSTTDGKFNIVGHSKGSTSITVRSVNNPNLSERIDVHVQ